eukprot:4827045-Amphidinium_carterae.2
MSMLMVSDAHMHRLPCPSFEERSSPLATKMHHLDMLAPPASTFPGCTAHCSKRSDAKFCDVFFVDMWVQEMHPPSPHLLWRLLRAMAPTCTTRTQCCRNQYVLCSQNQQIANPQLKLGTPPGTR